MSQEARDAVRGPAVGLKVYAVIGLLLAALTLATNVLGTGAGFGSQDLPAGMDILNSPAIGISVSLVYIAVSVFIWVGAGKMAELESHSMVMAVSILSMVPCVSPCCLLGLPVGIWALVVLNTPEVKQAFRA